MSATYKPIVTEEVYEHQGRKHPVIQIKRGPDDKYPLRLGWSKLDALFAALADPDCEEIITAFYDKGKKQKTSIEPQEGSAS